MRKRSGIPNSTKFMRSNQSRLVKFRELRNWIQKNWSTRSRMPNIPNKIFSTVRKVFDLDHRKIAVDGLHNACGFKLPGSRSKSDGRRDEQWPRKQKRRKPKRLHHKGHQ